MPNPRCQHTGMQGMHGRSRFQACAVLAGGSRVELLELANEVRVDEAAAQDMGPSCISQLGWTGDGQLFTVATEVRTILLVVLSPKVSSFRSKEGWRFWSWPMRCKGVRLQPQVWEHEGREGRQPASLKFTFCCVGVPSAAFVLEPHFIATLLTVLPSPCQPSLLPPASLQGLRHSMPCNMP